jgi:hypothetical protein
VCRPISGSGWLERQSDAIHAIPQAGRLGTIVEHMPKMAAAPRTFDSSAGHAEGGVLRRANRLVERRPETRPTCSTLELRIRREHSKLAAGASESAVPVLVEQWAGEWPLRCGLAKHRVLDRCQQLAPLRIAIPPTDRPSVLLTNRARRVIMFVDPSSGDIWGASLL